MDRGAWEGTVHGVAKTQSVRHDWVINTLFHLWVLKGREHSRKWFKAGDDVTLASQFCFKDLQLPWYKHYSCLKTQRLLVHRDRSLMNREQWIIKNVFSLQSCRTIDVWTKMCSCQSSRKLGVSKQACTAESALFLLWQSSHLTQSGFCTIAQISSRDTERACFT